MDSGTKTREALAEAAAPTLGDISRLAVTTNPRVSAMLFYIRDHLFDPKLKVIQARRACGLRDNSITLRFHRETGTAPGTFITDCRLVVAERLLAGSRIPVWKVAELIGYSVDPGVQPLLLPPQGHPSQRGAAAGSATFAAAGSAGGEVSASPPIC